MLFRFPKLFWSCVLCVSLRCLTLPWTASHFSSYRLTCAPLLTTGMKRTSALYRRDLYRPCWFGNCVCCCQSMPSGCVWRSRLRTGIEILGQLQWCWCRQLFLPHCPERTQSPETRWKWYNRSISVTKHQKAILCKAWSLLCWAKTLTATTWWITNFGIFQHPIWTQSQRNHWQQLDEFDNLPPSSTPGS